MKVPSRPSSPPRSETTIRSSILADARKRLDTGLPVEIGITGPRVRKIARSLHHYLNHLDTTRTDAQRRLSFLKWVFLADSSVLELWGICNSARSNGMRVEFRMIRESLVLRVGTAPDKHK